MDNGGKPEIVFAPSLRFTHAKINTEEVTCVNCGWPLSVPADTGSVLCAGLKRGDRKYAHQRCPTLRERAEMRKEALTNA